MEIKQQLMGMKTDEASTRFIELTGVPLNADQLQEELSKMHAQSFPSAQLMPGVKRLITYVRY